MSDKEFIDTMDKDASYNSLFIGCLHTPNLSLLCQNWETSLTLTHLMNVYRIRQNDMGHMNGPTWVQV